MDKNLDREAREDLLNQLRLKYHTSSKKEKSEIIVNSPDDSVKYLVQQGCRAVTFTINFVPIDAESIHRAAVTDQQLDELSRHILLGEADVMNVR